MYALGPTRHDDDSCYLFTSVYVEPLQPVQALSSFPCRLGWGLQKRCRRATAGEREYVGLFEHQKGEHHTLSWLARWVQSIDSRYQERSKFH